MQSTQSSLFLGAPVATRVASVAGAAGPPGAAQGPTAQRPEGGGDGPAPGWLTADCALFLDFDGTLVEIAAEPQSVQPAADLPEVLAGLNQRLNGALAVVSGRPIAEIDEQLQPLRLCVAGVHGAERRAADGYVRRMPVGLLDEAVALVAALCAQHPALRMERKPGAVALHYRQAPELEALCLATVEEAVQRSQGMALIRGKMVVEMKPGRATKGAAVRAYMDTAPFRSRRPWFFGDDVTDESAFEVVQAMGGVAVRVGEGETLATHRLPDPGAVLQWLQAALARLEAGRHGGDAR
ncbi:MAG: trehalose-phosphatase [Rhizobacter sp.]|nr:trehalose-phosphatase [Rhizobacter sp.]